MLTAPHSLSRLRARCLALPWELLQHPCLRSSGELATIFQRPLAGCAYGAKPCERSHRYSTDAKLAAAPYKILFAGSDRFSCETLLALHRLNHDIVDELHVLVGPDRRVSRGLKETYRPPLRKLAEELGHPIHVLPREGIAGWLPPPPFTSSSRSNLLITASFGYLIPPNILDLFLPLNTLNVHPSLLPQYRGAAPIQWAIANRDSTTGVTVQNLSRGAFDHGLVLSQERVDIPNHTSITYSALEALAARKGAELLVDTVKHLTARQGSAKPQNPGAHYTQVLKAYKIKPEHAQVHWATQSAEDVEARHRGFGHQAPLWTIFDGKRVQLLDVQLARSTGDDSTGADAGRAWLERSTQRVHILCDRNSLLSCGELKTEGRKALVAKQWWIGAARDKDSIQLGT